MSRPLPRVFQTTLLIALLLAPTTGATWSAFGTHEPDSSYDDAAFAFFDPASPGASRVYFNAFVTSGEIRSNANVGALATRIEPVAFEWHQAILGVWMDCNGDGYVGMAETAMREYPADLLLDDSRCPPVRGRTDRWVAGAYNYNGWVSEFISIGPYEDAEDKRTYRDDEARVWGDYGTPSGEWSRPSCALESLPPGGARSSGRLLDHADCQLSVLADEGTASAYRDLVATADPDNDLGLALEEEQWGRSTHPLNVDALGDLDSDGAMVSYSDCSAEPIYLTDERPPGSDLDYVHVYPPTDPQVDPEGSPSATVWALHEVVDGRWAGEGGVDNHCHDWKDDNDEFYGALEGETSDVYTSVKTAPNFLLRHHTQARGSAPFAQAWPGAAGAPRDGGIETIGATCRDHGCAPTRWYAPFLNLRSLPSLVKLDLNAENPRVDLADAYVMTYYAHVGVVTSERSELPPGRGIYGAPVCGDRDEGVQGGWECAPSLWYPDGEPYLGRHYERLPRVHDPYELRDVDCYDGGAVGLPAGAASLGNAPCPMV